MRRVTRNFILGIVAVLVLLVALGALPGLLKSGDAYYVIATPESAGGDALEGNSTGAAVDGATLSERSYPYTTDALARATADEAGESDPYWRGPVGLKESFTHSPFDEMNALRVQYPNATVADGVRVRRNATLYRIAVTQ